MVQGFKSFICCLLMTLVFYEASQYQMTYLSWLLTWFKVISGLRINLNESELISMGRMGNLEDLALEFGL